MDDIKIMNKNSIVQISLQGKTVQAIVNGFQQGIVTRSGKVIEGFYLVTLLEGISAKYIKGGTFSLVSLENDGATTNKN